MSRDDDSSDGEVIYLDHLATTPIDPDVRAAIDAIWDLGPANPHASANRFGWRAAEIVAQAQVSVARLIGARAAEIVFTSGATEANNLAIKGFASTVPPGRILVSAIEHPCVLEAARSLTSRGFEVVELPVGATGIVEPGAVADRLSDETRLISVMLANNEIGTIEPVAEIAALCRARNVAVHCDAAQAVGRIPVDVAALRVDLLSLSGHKLYGPLGIGALYVRSGTRLAPIFHGGAQQGGLRAGTVPTPLAAGLGKAADIAAERQQHDGEHLTELSDRLWRGLGVSIPGLTLLGPEKGRLPGCLNVAVPSADAEAWLLATPRIAAATGAACASGSRRPSHVLKAIGCAPEIAAGSIRLSVGRATTVEDVDEAVAALAAGLAQAFASAPVSQ